MFRFAAITIGCKVNQYETQAIAALLRRSGLRDADNPSRPPAPSSVEGSDLVIINTCCVTSSAAGKSRRAIRRAVRKNPDADIFILGCYATAEARTLHQVAAQTGAKGEIHVLGHNDNIAGCLQQYLSSVSGRGWKKRQKPQPAGPIRYDKCMRVSPRQPPAENRSCPDLIGTNRNPNVKKNFTGTDLPPIETFTGHQRAFVKVQDGCDAFCTYCIIPRLRSRMRSRPADEILREVAALVANGHREVVLCGIFLGAYGQPTAVRRKWTAPPTLPELLRRVAETPGLWRVRLSSLEPGDVTNELLDVFGNCPTIAPHLHLPLQSGSSRILKRMNRQYDAGQFLNAVRRIRETLTDAAITTDIMVGFPGETQEDFAETLDVARQAGVSKIHVFGFSPRPGTAAWNWRTEAPPPAAIKTRRRQLAELERELAENFRRRFIDRTVEAIVEQPNSKTPPACARGLTDRYIEVAFPANGEKNLAGRIARLRIKRLSNDGLVGTLTKNQ